MIFAWPPIWLPAPSTSLEAEHLRNTEASGIARATTVLTFFVPQRPTPTELPKSTTVDPTPSQAPAAGGDVVARLKHRRGTRWMHWINFPLLTIMIWSGLRIYWANDVYDLSFRGWTAFNFFPDGFNDALGLDRRLARGMAFHLTFGWLFVINGVAYGIYSLATREWRKVVPDRHSPRDAIKVVRHDLHLGGQLPPQPRYNGAQRITYSIVILMGAVVVATGFAIFKPVQLSFLTAMFGGYENARAIHFSVTLGFVAFFVLHLLQVIRAGWPNFTSMVTGYQIEPAQIEPATPSDAGSTEDHDEGELSRA
jgi:thiosulfate reductase cytochrome b subunit